MAGAFAENDVVNMYFESIKDFKPLDDAKERELIAKAQEGDVDSRNKVVNANLKFVVKVAKEYRASSVPFIDLISEGNLGLMEAVGRFDLSQNIHFITYAAWWIRQSIIKFIQDKSRLIRLPVNKNNDLMRINREIDGRNAKDLPIDIAAIAEKLDMDRVTVKSILDAASPYASLEQTIAGDESGKSCLGDMITAEYGNPENQMDDKDEKSCIENAVNELPDREREVLKMRYGLGEYSEMSLQDIGEVLNLTKERVRQLETLAISKVKQMIA